MTMLREFFWPNGERPGYALRWNVTYTEAWCEVTDATTAEYGDGRKVDEVMSDGGCGEMMPLDGPWVASFTVAIKFDGYARMWCEDLQLGSANGIAELVPLFDHIYLKADELMKAAQAIEDEEREKNRAEGRERIAASLERVKQRR